jgi:Putative Ig domain
MLAGLWRTIDQVAFVGLVFTASRGLWLLSQEVMMEWVQAGPILVGAAILVVAVAIYFVKAKPDVQADDAPMSVAGRRILVWFLVALGLCIAYSLVQISSADFPETSWDVVPVAQPGSAAAGATVLRSVSAQSNQANPSVVTLNAFGQNFPVDSKLRVKEREQPTAVLGPEWLQAQVGLQDLVGPDPARVDVWTAKGPSNAIPVQLRKALAQVALFRLDLRMSRELQLLLLAVLAGALGSYVHALKSLSDFIGNGTLTARWFWWYVTRPFLGMSMALVFYAVLRGGFLTGTPADAGLVNPFGVFAISALVGMFADRAAQKLGEIFDTLFKATDQRSGKLAAPVITKLEPETVRKGETTPVVLRITGERMGKVSKVRIKEEERKPDAVTEQQVTLTLKKEDVASAGELRVVVVDPESGPSPSATLHVVDIAITGTPLPDATAGTDYGHLIVASGGTAPYTYALVNPPAWLKIDAKKGELSGKPTVQGIHDIVVTVTDKTGISVSLTLPLTVK